MVSSSLRVKHKMFVLFFRLSMVRVKSRTCRWWEWNGWPTVFWSKSWSISENTNVDLQGPNFWASNQLTLKFVELTRTDSELLFIKFVSIVLSDVDVDCSLFLWIGCLQLALVFYCSRSYIFEASLDHLISFILGLDWIFEDVVSV